MDERSHLNGVIVIDKPEGPTSHDVVDRVRRALKLKRVGHTGTLDPFATGVLVVCLGKATRLQQFLTSSEKEYLARIKLGFATDTYDRTGKQTTPLVTSNGVRVEELQKIIDTFRGELEQVPPMYSAKKKEGVELYKLARRGETVERQPVKVTIYEVELIEEGGKMIATNQDGTQEFTLRVKCSAGTYMRSLADDIGERLGCGAHLADLKRTAAGEFRIEQAVTLDRFEQTADEGRGPETIVPLSRLLPHLPSVRLSEPDVQRIIHGQPLVSAATGERRYVRLVDGHDQLVAIGEHLPERGIIQPRVVLEG
jgi:tRNA pseudouridine55 synthase